MLPILLILVPIALYCLTIISFSYGLGRSIRYSKTKICESNQPISVVVAMRNEEKNIGNLLQSLSNQYYPKNLTEIIIINDHSTDSSPGSVTQWQERIPHLALINLPKGEHGKKNAVSLGIQQAKHNLIALTDADCTMPPTWLGTIAQLSAQANAAMIIGPVVMAADFTLTGRMGALEHASLTASTLGAVSIGMPIMASSANLAFRRDLVNFTPSMLKPSIPSGDDMFLLHSIKQGQLGPIIPISSPLGATYTQGLSSVKGILNQRARWASKAPAYRDWQTVLVGLIVILANLSVLVAFAIAMLNPWVWIVLIGVLIAKGVCDYLLLKKYLSTFKQTHLLKVFIPLQAFYPFYILYTLTKSLAWPTKWKERRTR